MKKILISLLITLISGHTYSQALDLTLSSYKGEPAISALNSITLKNGFHIAAGNNVRIFIANSPAINSVPSKNRNYVLTRSFRTSVKLAQLEETRNIDQENQVVQYYDGHGRLSQAVQVMGSPKFKDIVAHVEYDNYGRQSKNYLPYAEPLSADGSFKANASMMQASYYQAGGSWDPYTMKTATPYAETVFEHSSLNRIKEHGAPGDPWQPAVSRTGTSGRTVVTDYSTNGIEDVRLWKVNVTGASSLTYYEEGMLYKTITKDENWVNTNAEPNAPSKSGTIEEYQDLSGNLILKRSWQSESKKLETYYVYDDIGELRYVIPPAVTATEIKAESTDPNFENYVYAYKYDKRRRLAEKKLPGKGWQWIVYNSNNLPIMTQDAVQRKKQANEWNYTKYDVFNRMTEAGILTANYTDQIAAQKAADTYAASKQKYWEERTVAVTPGTSLVYTKYTNQSFPTENLSPRLVNYYDDHKFEGANTTGLNLSGSSYIDKNKTLLTGVKVYKDDGSSPLLTIHYHNAKGRLLQSISQNNLGGTDRMSYTYSYVGELLTSTRLHKVGDKTTTIVTKNEYDHVGRLLETKHKINEQAEVILAKNEYNEIGQLRQKKLHSENNGTNYLNTLDYVYNERGWVRSVNSAHFSYGLNYNVNTANEVLANAQYNGNIAEQLWGHGSTMPNTYSYDYDRLNRLINAASTGTVMKEAISYNDMGNIENLKRDGHASGTTYSYIGNQLKSLGGQITTQSDYIYDLNGNATKDHQGMLYSYNYLNLPKTATLSGTSVAFLYDALGTKLQKTAKVGSISTVREYVGGIEYNKVNGVNVIDMIHTSEGYLQNSGGTFSYHYNLTDHLGNVRATLQRTTATAGTVIQKHDYYAFGEPKAIAISGNNKYLFNGKEIQSELGGQYDYGARFYEGEIGRWNVMDPLAEKHYDTSPYAYAMNNPSTYIDLFGLDTLNNNNKFTPGQWQKFDPKKDVINLREITINPPNYFNNGWGNFDIFGNVGANDGFGNFGIIAPYYNPRPVISSSGTLQNRELAQSSNIKMSLEVMDLAGKIGDATSGLLEGAQYKQLLGTLKPSAAYGFKVYLKPILNTAQASPFVKRAGYLGYAVNLGGVGVTWMEEGHFGQQTKVATAKAVTGMAGAWAGAQIGMTAGAMFGAPVMGIGAGPGALIGGIVGAVVGGWGGNTIVETIYK